MMNPDLERQLAEEQDQFVWEAPAYERFERGPRWYVIMGAVALALVAYAIWTSNFLFAFLILLGAIILVLAGNERPSNVLIQVGHNGIVWDGEYVPYERVRNFAIVYQPPQVKVLYIQPRSYFEPRMRIHLGEQDPVALREHLKRYAAEDLALQDEHVSDIMARLLRL